MAANAGRLIAIRARFRFLGAGFFGLFRPRAGLRLAPLEVFAKCCRKPGLFPGVGGTGFFVHKDPLSRADTGFKLCLRGPDPYGKPCPRGGSPPRFVPVCCRSSVVEHLIGNEEVHSSILCGSTIPISYELLSRIFSARLSICRRSSESRGSP
jgi:hypothetical protein